MGKIIKNSVVYSTSNNDGYSVRFDNRGTSLQSTNVRDAIVELSASATESSDGLMSSEDKASLDSLVGGSIGGVSIVQTGEVVNFY